MASKLRFGLLMALVSLVAVLGTSALLGCQAAAPAQPLKKITLFTGTTPHFGSLFVAEKKGFWKEQGLDVEITVFTTGAAATEAFSAGRGDLVVAADLPIAKLWERGDTVGIAPQAHYTDLSMIVGKDSINRPSDLRGKKVAVRLGATPEFFLQKYLASEKVDPKEVTVLNLDPADMVVALDKGEIDAYAAWPPFTWQSLDKTKGVKIITTGKGYYTDWLIVAATKEYAKGHKDELKAFLTGLDKAGKYARDNLDEAAGLVAERLKAEKDMAKRMMQVIDWDISFAPQFRKDMDDLSEFMIGLKALNKKIDWSTAFDSSFLQMVSPGLVK